MVSTKVSRTITLSCLLNVIRAHDGIVVTIAETNGTFKFHCARACRKNVVYSDFVANLARIFFLKNKPIK